MGTPSSGLSRVGILAVAVALFAGCTTLGSLRDEAAQPWTAERPAGQQRVYPHPSNVVFRAALEATLSVGLELSEVDPRERYILSRRSASLWSWGELVGVYLLPLGPARTAVRVDSRRALATNITAEDFTASLFAALGLRVPPVEPPVADPNAGGTVLAPVRVGP